MVLRGGRIADDSNLAHMLNSVLQFCSALHRDYYPDKNSYEAAAAEYLKNLPGVEILSHELEPDHEQPESPPDTIY